MAKSYHNPPELFDSTQFGFSQIVSVPATGRIVYISGQVAWDNGETIIGPGDFPLQITQTFRNLATAMATAGGQLSDIVSMRIYFLEQKADELSHISAALKEHFPVNQAPATTWIGVRALADPAFMIEIEATAVIV